MSNLVPIKRSLNAVLLVCLQYHPEEFPPLPDGAMHGQKKPFRYKNFYISCLSPLALPWLVCCVVIGKHSILHLDLDLALMTSMFTLTDPYKVVR